MVLLDIMLPEEDGLQILKKLRADGRTRRTPVIMLTAKGSEYDKVIGLEAGADDYIPKPFGMMELIARVKALLRRASDQPAPETYPVGCLTVCPQQHHGGCLLFYGLPESRGGVKPPGVKTGIAQSVYHQFPDAGVVFYQIDHNNPPDIWTNFHIYYFNMKKGKKKDRT